MAKKPKKFKKCKIKFKFCVTMKATFHNQPKIHFPTNLQP